MYKDKDYIADDQIAIINRDKLEFFTKSDNNGNTFYLLVSGIDGGQRCEFVDTIFNPLKSSESENTVNNNNSVIEAILTVNSKGEIATPSVNINISKHIEQQYGGYTQGGLWVKVGDEDNNSIENAANKVRNIASMYNSLDSGRNPPEMFISLTSRNEDLKFCRLPKGDDIKNTTAMDIQDIILDMNNKDIVVMPFITNTHMSVIVIIKKNKKCVIYHIDSLGKVTGIMHRTKLRSLINDIKIDGGYSLEIINRNPVIQSMFGKSCSYMAECNIVLSNRSILNKGVAIQNVIIEEELDTIIESREYRTDLINSVLLTLCCNDKFVLTKKDNNNFNNMIIRTEEFILLENDNIVDKSQPKTFTVKSIVDCNASDIFLPDTLNSNQRPKIIRRITTSKALFMLLEQFRGGPDLNNEIDPNKFQSEYQSEVDSILYIKNITTKPKESGNVTTINLKTNNTNIFKDIEEIEITIPKDIKDVNGEYLDKLYNEIINKGFDNDIINLKDVNMKKKNKDKYEPLGRFMNTHIINECSKINKTKAIM